MTRAYLPILVTVAAIWGASYMFIELAVDEIAPAALMDLRLFFAALVLVPFLLVQQGLAETLRDLRATAGGTIFLGFMNMALPFTLIAWGQKHIDSGVAAIANAPVPLFVALLALRWNRQERATPLGLAGMLLGFAGVAVLVGFQPEGGWWPIAGTLAVLAATIAYATSNVFAQSRFHSTQPLVVVTGSCIAGTVLLLPLAVVQAPDELPSAGALGSVAVLGVVGTAVALILYFRMLALFGAGRSSLVTYLLPPFALVYGVVLLGESLSANALVGLALILGGVALASGLVGPARRREVVPATPRA